VLYLFQERELLSRRPGRFYYLIPSLERSDTLGWRAVLGGFGFLTLAILTGFLWNHSLLGRFWTGDPKEWAALVAWLIYVAILVARGRGGWGGRRAAWLAIAGFAVVVFTFAWATLVPAVAVAGR
jgi:ABC-type transport system involved in cytochrome c biogenesis permease subunit